MDKVSRLAAILFYKGGRFMTGKMRALRICLVIALVLLIFLVGYTFAKYYSEIYVT